MQIELNSDDEVVQRMLQLHFPKRRPTAVRRADSLLPNAQCYDNVRRVINERGGSYELGWHLTAFPDHFVEAQHHAVWRSPDGALLDVTAPSPTSPIAPQICFLQGARAALGPQDPAVPSRFVQLDNHAATARYIVLAQLRMQLIGELMDLIKAARSRPSRPAPG